MQAKEKKNCIYESLAGRNLSKDEICELKGNCSVVDFQPGEIIIKENTLAKTVAYIKNGLVKVHALVHGKEKTLRIIKGNQYVCLPSNFFDNFNHFSATAVEKSEVCFLDLTVFKKFIKENGAFAYDIIHDLSKSQVTNLHNQVENNNKKTIGRIAHLLLFFARDIYDSLEYCLPISRQEIGDLVSATRESVSRTLADFQNDNIIEIDRKKVIIKNEKFLEEISVKG